MCFGGGSSTLAQANNPAPYTMENSQTAVSQSVENDPNPAGNTAEDPAASLPRVQGNTGLNTGSM